MKNRKAVSEVIATIIIILITIGAVAIVWFLVISTLEKGYKCNNCFETSNEALSQEFSGDILNDLEFCSISIIDNDTHLINHFSFLGIDRHPNYECRNIKESCEQSDNCFWIIHKGSAKSGNEKYWHTEFTGTCVCRGEIK